MKSRKNSSNNILVNKLFNYLLVSKVILASSGCPLIIRQGSFTHEVTSILLMPFESKYDILI
jgi:hypothetical protein